MSGNGAKGRSGRGGNGRKSKKTPSPNGGKDESTGRFVKGNPGGPGNPHGATMEKNRAALLSAVLSGDVSDAVGVFKDVMMDTDQPASARIQAADKFLAHVCGKPQESMELTGNFTLTEFYHAVGRHLRAS